MDTRSNYSFFVYNEIRPGKQKISLRSMIDRRIAFFLCKRVFDLCISLLFVLFILSWLIPVIALLIRLDTRGPVFFRQKRTGRGGRSFTCYKFRSMVVNEKANEIPVSDNDPRITRMGRFLRSSYLDECPQFLNVMFGHMSIVGPRPHMRTDCNKFSSLIPGYKFRNFVKPGITGLAQVKGFHGRILDEETIFWRYQWDAFYVRNASWGLDFRIIRQTIRQCIDAIPSSFAAAPAPASVPLGRSDHQLTAGDIAS
jgi:putative colanic acid biosynthesis UDP-glucose lipid carrier transferase